MLYTKTRELKEAAGRLRILIIRDYKLSGLMIDALVEGRILPHNRTVGALTRRGFIDIAAGELSDEGKEVANVLRFENRMAE